MKKILLLLIILLNIFVLTSCNEESETEETVPTVTEKNYIEVSIADAIIMAESVGEQLTTLNLCVTGTISAITNAEYGNMKITDGTDTINIYGLFDENNVAYKDMENKPIKGDVVTIYGPVHSFGGVPEFKNAILVSFTHVKPEVDDSYQEVSIAEARTAEKGAKLVIEGVVAQITYAFGFVKNGFYVVDDTGSIYVYGDDAQRVNVGDTVKLGGTKDYYILADEQKFAEKYGYQGSCQLKDTILLEHTEGNAEFNKEWIEETTVKAIMDTPLSNNITTNIYKVNALITKVPSTGYTNYYIDDIDGTTGTYVYTANNGNDFTWLDEFDGKICTVYLSVINCKSSAGGCNYRFVPILVLDENYRFDLTKAPDYAITYKAFDQFKTKYNADPALELVTTVSSQLLGFENVSVEYSSSNTDVIYFVTENGKTVMHTKDLGTATITIKATHNQNVSTKTLDITVSDELEFDAITVGQAIESEDGTEVIVEGIVMSSLVNRDGFYLWDETGVIAVVCPKEEAKELKPGDKVVVEGTRIHNKKDTTTHAIGQSAIGDAKVLANFYGNHEINTDNFITDVTIPELYELDPMKDYSTNVYVITGIIEFYKADYSTGVDVYTTDKGTKIALYCSGSGQYSWLEPFVGKEVTIEIMMCNWNDKSYYRGTIVSVTYNGEKTINQLNFN